VHEQKAQSGSGDILPMLREIVDTIYSGPPIDYIVLNSE
jgi:hypothetical protein